jgi:hypothetical protein
MEMKIWQMKNYESQEINHRGSETNAQGDN